MTGNPGVSRCPQPWVGRGKVYRAVKTLHSMDKIQVFYRLGGEDK